MNKWSTKTNFYLTKANDKKKVFQNVLYQKSMYPKWSLHLSVLLHQPSFPSFYRRPMCEADGLWFFVISLSIIISFLSKQLVVKEIWALTMKIKLYRGGGTKNLVNHWFTVSPSPFPPFSVSLTVPSLCSFLEDGRKSWFWFRTWWTNFRKWFIPKNNTRETESNKRSEILTEVNIKNTTFWTRLRVVL